MATPAGWYPDPSGEPGQRYWDGTKWTEHLASPLAASPPTAKTPGLSRNQKIGLGALAGVIAMVVIGSLANGGSDKDEKSTAHSTTTSVAPTTVASPVAAPPATATPTGPIAPVGVNFHTESDADGDVVFADFDIKDALFMGLTKFGARETTKDILEYAQTEYPQASKVVVQGRFPTKDAYGNSANSVVLNVFYTRETLDKINFAGIDNDKIWDIRDGGMVHPDLQ